MGNRYKELEGVRFGRLTALYPLKRRDQRGCVYWRCRCDCGEEAEVSENNLVLGHQQKLRLSKAGVSAEDCAEAPLCRWNLFGNPGKT